jgi:ADP-ribose pyrophosphatase YjhB (NUDIX family)
MLWRRRIEPLIRPLFFRYARVRRGLTMGVRGVVLDNQGRVLLVEHTYVSGWHLPGGGVERGETAEQAMGRELAEEAGVVMIGRPTLVSVHSNHAYFPGDHVLVFRIDRWRPARATSHGEIHAIGWFAPDALPEATTAPTRRRITEVLASTAAEAVW